MSPELSGDEDWRGMCSEKEIGMALGRPISKVAYCQERNRLLDELLRAICAITALLDEQAQALMEGDPDFTRFDILLQYAQIEKDEAKYAWFLHVESHGCCA